MGLILHGSINLLIQLILINLLYSPSNSKIATHIDLNTGQYWPSLLYLSVY